MLHFGHKYVNIQSTSIDYKMITDFFNKSFEINTCVNTNYSFVSINTSNNSVIYNNSLPSKPNHKYNFFHFKMKIKSTTIKINFIQDFSNNKFSPIYIRISSSKFM